MTANSSSMYALLIGIDNYKSPRIPALGGCVNDVNAIEQLLRQRYGVPSGNILKLIDDQATHQAIQRAFRDHLIAQVQAWVDAGRPHPVPAFLIYYSGHGSQALDESGTEPDGMDETLVPYDSRVGDVYDIKDWELGQLLDELTAPLSDEDANVTVVLDCCHSGSGTRELKPTLVPTRRCEPDLRPQPASRPAAAGARMRSISAPSGWELGARYVLLAGCRDREEANEHRVSQSPTGYRRHGAMTYFILDELSRLSPDRPITYRELHERVRYQVNSRYEDQMPQCEGPKDRTVFGGLAPRREVMLSVVDANALIWVDGGAAHGLTEGSQLYVYPPGTTAVSDGDQPQAVLYVVEAGAVRSGCVVEKGNVADIQISSPVRIAYRAGEPMRCSVVVDIEDQAVRNEVETLLHDPQLTRSVQQTPSGQPADLRVQQVDQNLELQDASGKPLVAAYPPDKRDELVGDLRHIARFKNALKLANADGASELAGAVQVTIQELLVEGGQLETREIGRNAEGEVEIETGQRIVIEITHTADRPLYVTVLDMTHDWSIVRLYPRAQGAHEALDAGRSIRLGFSPRRSEQLAAQLPEGVSEAREYIKVIATAEEADFELLEMGSLKAPGQARAIAWPGPHSALNDLLEQAAQGSGTRAFGAPPPTVQDEWTTAELQFRLIRPATDPASQRVLRGGAAASVPGFALTVEPPQGFVGSVRILTARQQTRALEGDLIELAPPPGLAPFGSMFQAISVPSSGTRHIGPGGAAIEIEADDFSRAAVTAETPLKLHLPEGMAAEDESTLALAYDGSLFYPVGRPGETANTLHVEWLPQAAPPAEEAVRTRNLGRTVKLYLFKMVRVPEPSLGLRTARFVPGAQVAQEALLAGERSYEVKGGEARYRSPRADELQAGQRVALFVHGFTSETRWMVGGILPWLESKGLGYDHYMTFDYETFNTRITENGLLLANALRTAGLSAADDIHVDVFAHSMGAQVVRSMVEQHGGEDLVDRCFLAGPPNQGTRLAEAQRLVPWIGTLLLNQMGPTPPSVIASWVLKKVAGDAVGLDDLRPTSEFLALLNGTNKPARVPYRILAGRHDLPDEFRNIWDRLAKTLIGAADAGLDMLFGDQHDLVVNLRSMLTVRDGSYPANLLRTHVLPCNHFQYFDSVEGQETLASWLSES